jgi:beta-N-acetylhexosaminidase
MQAATLAALLGEIPWQGTSPVDPFCGLEDARL